MARRSTCCVILAAMALSVVNPEGALAQQTSAPRQLFRGAVEPRAPWLALLREASAHGSQEKLVSVVAEFLKDLAQLAGVRDELSRAGFSCCSDRKSVYQVAFLASEAFDAPLVRIFVHRDGLHRGSLPGLAGGDEPLFEVFVAEDVSVRLASIYQSEPLENPLDKESARFVETVLSRIGLPLVLTQVGARLDAGLQALAETLEHVPPMPRHPPLAVTVAQVDLPFRRARVTVSHTVSADDPLAHIVGKSAWIADAARRQAVIAVALGDLPPDDTGRITREVERLEAEYPRCGVLAGSIAHAAATTTTEPACSPLGAEPERCFKAITGAMDAAYRGGAAACAAARAYPLLRRFLSIVPVKAPQQSRGAMVLLNQPKTHWTLGLSTGFIAAMPTDTARPRAKISSGRIVVDPFSRVLAMGIVSFVPGGYDPGSVHLRRRERFRVFGGVAFAPHFGGTAGAAWAFNRYLGANVGYAHLLYDTPKPGESFDAQPSAANRAAPFRLGRTHALFVGLTYNLR